MDQDFAAILGEADERLYDIRTSHPGPSGKLPLTDRMLRTAPSGDLFGWSQNVGMGWQPSKLGGKEFLLLSTQGGIRREDGAPIALGYHTGHWEVGLLMEEAAQTIAEAGGIPFAGYVSDPCDGRSQGTTGMYDSLPYRNDAAIVLRRLIRSMPTRRGVIGVATCDKGLPAMMIALAGMKDLPGILIPGGVTLPPDHGEDAGKIQTIGARYANGEITLEAAAELGCRACATPGGPEALAGGPIGKLRDGDLIEIVIHTRTLEGTIHFLGDGDQAVSPEEGAEILRQRPPHPGLAADPYLPEDTRLWAALQAVSGGTWRGCVYDVDRIIDVIEAGKRALGWNS